MSTLDVTCGRCDKRFRVRAEFAGKSTRCPGCSAPITIGGSKAPPPPREERAERPRPRPRSRDEDDETARRPASNWKPVATALAREQVAVVFALLTILGSYLVLCLSRAAVGPYGPDGILLTFMLLVLVGPTLVAAVAGLTARIAAVGAPAESLAKGSAVVSLLCSLAGLGCLLMLGLGALANLDRTAPSELPMLVATGGLVVSALGAIGTFGGFVAQIGIARRSAAVSRAVGRTAVAAGVCVLGLLAVGVLGALAAELSTPSYPQYGPNNWGPQRGHNEMEVLQFLFMGLLLPMSVGVMLILYHRLLAAARRAVVDEPTGRYDD